ncbi:MAG TPA: hypothetical protein PLN91_09170 [Rhodanobacteraceae bacterium]|nr:hypothetical protein [Rhodanobacteraceae bacterium]
MRTLRLFLADALQFFLAPGLAALLPWRLARRWLRWLAGFGRGPFAEASRAALATAPAHFDVGDAARFAADVRLVWLLDTTDLYLSLRHRDRAWRPWHVQRVGEWPRGGAFIATGFHHGTGLWAFRSLAEAGRDSMLVSARWDRGDFAGLPLRYAYGRLRGAEVERLGANPVAFRPGARAPLSAALARGACVVGVIDMPPRLAPRGQRPVRLLGQRASFPDGLLALAREAGVPLVPYWIEFDLVACTRRLCIGAPLDPHDVDGTLQALADILDAQIRRTPAAWTFWPEWPQWLTDAAAIAAPEASPPS